MDMFGEQGVLQNTYHPVMSINQPRQMLAMTNSNGHSGGYWLNLSCSYPGGRMRLTRTYPGFSKWDFIKPSESMSKENEKRCMCLSSQPVCWPENVGPTSVKGREIHSPSIPCEVLSGRWLEDGPLISPLSQSSHIYAGVENTKKKKINKREKRSWGRADCGTLYPGKWSSKQNSSEIQARRNLEIVILKKRNKVGELNLLISKSIIKL